MEKMAEKVVEVIKENEALVGGTDDKRKSITVFGAEEENTPNK